MEIKCVFKVKGKYISMSRKDIEGLRYFRKIVLNYLRMKRVEFKNKI
jgi:hypothetical protein